MWIKEEPVREADQTPGGGERSPMQLDALKVISQFLISAVKLTGSQGAEPKLRLRRSVLLCRLKIFWYSSSMQQQTVQTTAECWSILRLNSN